MVGITRKTIVHENGRLRMILSLFVLLINILSYNVIFSNSHVKASFHLSFPSSSSSRSKSENNLISHRHNHRHVQHRLALGWATELSLGISSSLHRNKYKKGILSRVGCEKNRMVSLLESRGGGGSDDDAWKQRQSLSSSSYYLLNYVSIWGRIVCYTGIWVLLTRQLMVSPPGMISNTLSSLDTAAKIPKVVSSLLNKVILPLLSSACCSIQLFMNLFGIGCAGFNTQLGPLRPLFTSFLLTSTILSASSSFKWMTYTAITWFIALMPEIIHFSNERTKNRHLSSSTDAETVVIELDVPSMGCVACINKINSSLLPYLGEDNANGVAKKPIADASSWLLEPTNDGTKRGGKVQLRIQYATSDKQVKQITRKVMDAINNAGFPNTLSSSSNL